MPKEDKIYFEWEAPEFKHYHKNVLWYILFGIVAAGLIIASIINKDYFGAITTVILAGLIIFFTRRKPEIVAIKITNRGFNIGNIHIPHQYVKNFRLVEAEHHRTINLETNTYVGHTVIIELGDQDPEPIRDFLVTFLPEHDHNEPSFSQKMAHRFKV